MPSASETNRVVTGLSKIIQYFQDNNDKKGNATTWKSVSVYLDFRKGLASQLESREAKSINAKSNADLKIVYDAVVKKLKKDDPLGFSPLYDRFLSQDLVVDKYLTPRTPKENK